jgi:protein-S-isoprenylcysteine O-methyltransferase Ste14
MRSSDARLLISLSLIVGGGSLVLFLYFVLFGNPIGVHMADSERGRLAVDALLCLAFFAQHSGMIRRSSKERIAKAVPSIYQGALYSIASGATLILLVVLWQPTEYFFFHLHGPARWLSACVVLLAIAGFVWGVRALGVFDPFGILPLEASLRGTQAPVLPFVARGPYRYSRHPLYLFMLLLIWSTPRFSLDQLLFNVLWTAWVIVGTKLEEGDLAADFGETYRQYKSTVPMPIPSLRFLRPHNRPGSSH